MREVARQSSCLCLASPFAGSTDLGLVGEGSRSPEKEGALQEEALPSD